ncbi:MAG: hypothetical protein E6446_00180 [Gemella haemolysans]|nr:hypothetical protein [Gemella haemolysans]
MKGRKREDLEEVLKVCRRTKNQIVEEKYFDILREYDEYADDFIEYYLNSQKEEKYVVKFKYEMIDYVLGKANRQKKSLREQVVYILDNKQKKFILMKHLRKIEYLLDIDLRNYIGKVGLLDNTYELKVLSDKEECDIMYDIARRLSVKHNIGYILSYVEKTLEVENGKIKLELYWHKGCVFHGEIMVANLLIGTNKVVEKIARYVEKETRLKDEIK